MEHNSEVEPIIKRVLGVSESLLPNIDQLDYRKAEILYEQLNIVAKFAAKNIGKLSSTELRVKLCDYRDQVLDAIIDKTFEDLKSNARHLYSPFLISWKYWYNELLLKDVGTGPYMLAKALGIDATSFFGTTDSEYPYLDYLPNLNLVLTDSRDDYNKRKEQYVSYLVEHFKEMDLLTFHGPYVEYVIFLNYYKRLRPDGKIYITLDMNRYWKMRVPWQHPLIQSFFNQCDVIADSSRTMRDNENRDPSLNVDCSWIPNGFYNAYNVPVIADVKRKENILLTVGRIGLEVKNNEEMLLAFAVVSEALPTWNLHLVGSIDERIKPFIQKYFELFPHLKNRVLLKGKIIDKADLYKEYAKAKIFILTSRLEGFPNVYAEALYHGCYFITSDIDCSSDMTNFGKLGVTYPSGNVNGLSNVLLETCKRLEHGFSKKMIDEALAYARRYFDWERNAKKMAYMLYHSPKA